MNKTHNKIHLVQYLMPPVTHHSTATWKHPRNMMGGQFRFDRPEIWQHVARLCEQAKYDAVFLADVEGLYSDWGASPAGAVQYGSQSICFEPTIVLTWMAAATSQLGLVMTLTTNSYPPYVAARKFATLDHLSAGRAGWNLVAAFHQAAFQNLGQTHVLDHAERYERADEYLDLCYRLWDSWEEDAVVMDSAGDTFADPTKVHEVNFEGKWFQCRGPLNIHRSPQGKPVIAQAGQSEQGRAFAAKHAEIIFSIQPYRDGMQEYYADVKARMQKCDRDPDTCKILFGMQPIVGETPDSARAKADFHNALLTPEGGLVQLSAVLGQDLSQLNLDDPLANLPPAPGIQGLLDAYTHSSQGKTATIRDMALDMSRGVSVPQVVGTPEQIADWMQETMQIVGGDGFILSPVYLPGSIEEFASMVVPVLQRRRLVRTEYTNGTLRDNLLAF